MIKIGAYKEVKGLKKSLIALEYSIEKLIDNNTNLNKENRIKSFQLNILRSNINLIYCYVLFIFDLFLSSFIYELGFISLGKFVLFSSIIGCVIGSIFFIVRLFLWKNDLKKYLKWTEKEEVIIR